MQSYLGFVAGYIALAVLLLSCAGSAYALMAAWLAGRFARRAVPQREAWPAVTLLKPLHGMEAGLDENLESFCRLDYPGPVQIVFGVHEARDTALGAVERLRAKFPDADIAIVADTRVHGSNPKVTNLINMMAAARHGMLAVSDSDIRVPRNWLRHVVAGLEQPGVGIVTCLYTGAAARDGVWPMLAAMGSSYEFLPNVLVGVSSGLATPCFGSTMALRRSMLEEIGGFEHLADYLADDYELGRAVRAKGHALYIPPLTVEHRATDASLKAVLRHELRWSRTTRLLDPVGHLGSIVTLSLPLAVLGCVLSGANPLSGFVILCSLGARHLLKWRLDRIFGISAGPAWLLPLRDMLSFVVYVGSLYGGTVHWRGRRFEVEATGAMSGS